MRIKENKDNYNKFKMMNLRIFQNFKILKINKFQIKNFKKELKKKP